MAKHVVCRQCKGYKYLICKACGGHGKVRNPNAKNRVEIPMLACGNCHTKGKIRCPVCSGTGKELKE